MLDFSYTGVIERSGIAPPAGALAAALDRVQGADRLWVDRASFKWVGAAVEAWAKRSGAELRPLPKVRGAPVLTGEPALLCVPDRAGFAPPDHWIQPADTIVIRHVFRAQGDLHEIRVDGPAGPPAHGPTRRGRRLAGRLRQIAGVTVIAGTHDAWCSFLQPGDPAVVLAKLAGDGIIGGEPLDLPEFAGGIGAVVPGTASDRDLDRYAAAVVRALT